jgi:hypothetical protein
MEIGRPGGRRRGEWEMGIKMQMDSKWPVRRGWGLGIEMEMGRIMHGDGRKE